MPLGRLPDHLNHEWAGSGPFGPRRVGVHRKRGGMTDIHVTERSEQTTAVLRERVPMGEMPAFFQRAFHATMAALQAQGVHQQDLQPNE